MGLEPTGGLQLFGSNFRVPDVTATKVICDLMFLEQCLYVSWGSCSYLLFLHTYDNLGVRGTQLHIALVISCGCWVGCYSNLINFRFIPPKINARIHPFFSITHSFNNPTINKSILCSRLVSATNLCWIFLY